MSLQRLPRNVNPAARHVCRFLALALVLPLAAAGQLPYPPELTGTRELVYSQLGETQLKLWLCEPPSERSSPRPALVLFFGGGWRQGSPQQFLPHCRYLAERGLVVALADYRVANRHGTTADACVVDAKAAVAFLRQNAENLGVDPRRIAAGGGSAGGHLAAATALLSEYNPFGIDDPSLWRPDALALFNPALVLAPRAEDTDAEESQSERWGRLEQRLGGDLESMSPFHQLSGGLPPTLIFHGLADATVPHESVQAFCDRARELGNSCTLESYPDAGHGFFNHGRGDGSAYFDTLAKLDTFFVELGWIEEEAAGSGI